MSNRNNIINKISFNAVIFMEIFLFEFLEMYKLGKLITEDTNFTHSLFVEMCFMFSYILFEW